jgi:AcrR family transcriptional regulator
MATAGAVERRPQRADARRNYAKLVAAAAEAFAEKGADASLEDVARRAGVGIGTLYRHFPTRQALLEATYLEEVEGLCASAADLTGLPPWEGFAGYLDRLAHYIATKRALSSELLASLGKESEFFRRSHDAIFEAGEPLLVRAQEAGVVRPDVDLGDVMRLVSGVLMVQATDPDQQKRLLGVALDGLRYGG